MERLNTIFQHLCCCTRAEKSQMMFKLRGCCTAWDQTFKKSLGHCPARRRVIKRQTGPLKPISPHKNVVAKRYEFRSRKQNDDEKRTELPSINVINVFVSSSNVE